MRYSIALFLLVLVAGPASAHEVRPAYLQLHQTGADTYDVLWKVPALGDTMRLSLYVQLPQACSNVKPPRGLFADNATRRNGASSAQEVFLGQPSALMG
jgi:hypothetical protein